MTKQNTNIFQSALARKAAFILTVGSLLAAAGVFNTEAFPAPVRFGYWISLIAIGVWLGGAINAQLTPLTENLPWVGKWLISSTAVTAPMVGMVALVQGAVGYPVPAAFYAELAIKVWIITAGVTAVRLLQDSGHAHQSEIKPVEASQIGEAESTAQAADDATLTTPPKIALRLPEKMRRAEIWALSAEDHYVRVHTSEGEELILMRFADAIAEADGIDGIQTHRSWWIARDGVDTIRKRTEGGVVVLKSGAEAPVSRRRFAEVEATNWA